MIVNNKIKRDVTAVLIIVAFYIFLAVTHIGCPIRYLTGISCAGCGMTRAWYSAAYFDFEQAMEYHPLFWVVLPVFVVILLKDRINRSVFNIIIITVIVAFLGVYAVRLFDTSDSVVTVDMKNGVVLRTIKYIIGGIKLW